MSRSDEHFGKDYVAGGSPLTGRKVLLIFVAFFGVYALANSVMVSSALRTFAGLESKASFREGVQYDRQIAAARAQDDRGWKVDASVKRGADGRVAIAVQPLDKQGQPLAGLVAKVRLSHPADIRRDVEVELKEAAPGAYSASVDAADGAWTVVIELERQGETLFKSRNRIMLGG